MSNRKPILTKEFRNKMYDNMWSFMNLDMIRSMFPDIKVSEKKYINDDKFYREHSNTICFKGDIDEGHYVYVDKKLKAHSTFESNLLYRDEDDGICHGAALAFYLSLYKKSTDYKLIELPEYIENKDINIYKHNYKTILKLYIYLIESGLWDKALSENFYNDVRWILIKNKETTQETQYSLKLLKEYIKRFN